MRVSDTLFVARHTTFDIAATFLSFPNLADNAALPWLMANFQVMATTRLTSSSEWHLSAGVLHGVDSTRVLGALQEPVSTFVEDPAIRGELWSTVGLGASTRLASGPTLRAELSIVLQGAALAGSTLVTGAPVVLTLGASAF